MKRLSIYLLLCLLALPSLGWAHNVSNLKVRQQGKTIEILYDLDAKSIVTVSARVGRQRLEMKSVVGAVGLVEAGSSRRIIWKVLDDYERFVYNDVQFTVEASSLYSGTRTFILGEYGFGAIPQHSGGLMAGQMYKYAGWYVSGRSNFCFSAPSVVGICGAGGLVDGKHPFYSGNSRHVHYMANVGAVVDLTGNHWEQSMLALYAGAGYGFRSSYWETTDGNWLQYTPTAYRGVSAQLGLMGSIKGFTLNAGVSTIAFKYMELEVGLGYTINHKRKI